MRSQGLDCVPDCIPKWMCVPKPWIAWRQRGLRSQGRSASPRLRLHSEGFAFARPGSSPRLGCVPKAWIAFPIAFPNGCAFRSPGSRGDSVDCDPKAGVRPQGLDCIPKGLRSRDLDRPQGWDAFPRPGLRSRLHSQMDVRSEALDRVATAWIAIPRPECVPKA